MKIRNIAIIAHVDHGKTTLVDQLLKSAHTFQAHETTNERMMDSNDIEQERGITILAKATGIAYKDFKINILDTPGHADFGGEVERIMNMVDGCLLLIDAFEGTMPQTRFVLKRALEARVKPIVVINKVDRPNINVNQVVDDVLHLFIELNAPEEFLDFKVVYASGLKGTSSLSPDLNTQQSGMDLLLDLIIQDIPSPRVRPEQPLQFQASLLDYNDFVGRIGIGLIHAGKMKQGQRLLVLRHDGSQAYFKVQKIVTFVGLNRVDMLEASAGDIVGVAGLADMNVGETVCEPDHPLPLPTIHVSEPTLQMTFGPNSSPFVGKSGEFVTYRQIEARLMKEIQKDVSLRVKRIENSESFLVSGRGELHLGILIENMRREGFELEVSKPQVIIKIIDEQKHEPYEEVFIDIPHEYLGLIMDAMAVRSGSLLHMESLESITRLTYEIPSRGLIGFQNHFMTLTKGYGIINHAFKEYRPLTGVASHQRKMGALVATETGTATTYAIEQIEDRGTLFITPGTEVYEGMIVGENKYDRTLVVNVAKTKALTNMRMSNKELKVVLKAPRRLSLEECLDYINDDELVEITPTHIRMRKKILKANERKRYQAFGIEEESN